MRSPTVVPALEFGAQERQVVKPLDDRDASQPLVLEGLDDPLGYADGAVLSYGSETGFDTPLSEQLGKGVSDKDTGLIGDDVFRCPMFLQGLLQGLDDPEIRGSGIHSSQTRLEGASGRD